MEHSMREPGAPAFKVSRDRLHHDFVVRDSLKKWPPPEKAYSHYPLSQRPFGVEALLNSKKDGSLSVDLVYNALELQRQLLANHLDMVTNIPEVFPYDDKRCLIVVTGYVGEQKSIIVNP